MTNRIPDDAFDFYVGLGAGRSYRAVALKYGVTKRAVTKLAGRDRWAERLSKIEAEAREKGDKRLAETLDEMRERHLKLIRVMAARSLEALKAYPLTTAVEAARVGEMTIKLERLVAGEASERTAVSVEEVTRREIQDLLATEEDDDDEAW